MINDTGKLVKMEKVEVLNNIFTESSVTASLPTPSEWMDGRMGEQCPSHFKKRSGS